MKGVGFYESDFMKIKEEDELIAESITRILMTTPGERVGRPTFGCELRKLIFESQADIYVDDVKRMINKAINQFEPRVNLKDIELSANENTLYIRIKFNKIGNPQDENFLDFNFNLES